jgi:hypothetical protein
MDSTATTPPSHQTVKTSTASPPIVARATALSVIAGATTTRVRAAAPPAVAQVAAAPHVITQARAARARSAAPPITEATTPQPLPTALASWPCDRENERDRRRCFGKRLHRRGKKEERKGKERKNKGEGETEKGNR